MPKTNRMANPWLPLLFSLTALAASDEPRWQKIDATGKTLSVKEGPWACVLDRQTGLVWENKSDSEGRHFAAATYSWHDPARGVGPAAAGSCVARDGEVFGCDTNALVQLAREERWCGLDDWRVPDEHELASLLYDTGFVGSPRIATGYFPHAGRFPYWTSNLRQDAEGRFHALLVHFGTGEQLWLPMDRVARLRLVSAQLSSPSQH